MELKIVDGANKYIESVRAARSENTARSYRNSINLFLSCLEDNGMNPANQSILDLSETSVTWFVRYLKGYSPASESLYVTAVAGFFEYLAAEEIIQPNLTRMRMIIKQRTRKPGKRLPQFPKQKISEILSFYENPVITHSSVESRLRFLRDRSFILTLADTGMRVHEACQLRRGDIDWYESKAQIIGKGNQQAVVRFSTRSLNSLRDYLHERKALDGNTGRQLASLPLFARHDKGAGKKIKPISTTTGRKIVKDAVNLAIGNDGNTTITPHSFRHYFVTTVLQASGGNLKLAQELARHKNITVTQRYAHLNDDELDSGYHNVFG